MCLSHDPRFLFYIPMAPNYLAFCCDGEANRQISFWLFLKYAASISHKQSNRQGLKAVINVLVFPLILNSFHFLSYKLSSRTF